jgi:hypothetical protein
MGIAIDLAAANLSQSELILAISIEVVGHAAPLPAPSSILTSEVEAGSCI